MRSAGIAAAVAAVLTASPAHATRAGKPVSATGKACTVVGTVGNDRLFGTHGYDVICGLGGNDVIKGGGGRDVVDGGPGDDDLDGEDGTDVVIGGPGDDRAGGGAGNDQVKGGDGADVVDGGPGADLADGGPGDDTVSGGTAEPDPVSAGDRVIGGDGDDTLDGGPGADTLKGDDGADTVDGGAGNDVAGGGAGDDTLSGDEGSDRLDGGEGTDHLEGGGGSDGVNGGGGDDTLGGGTGDDTIRGGPGADTASGGDGDDSLDGGTGDDRMDGGGGDDVVEGGPGSNVCVNDPGDEAGDRCTDRKAPRLDIASLTWVTDPAVDNRADRPLRLRAHVTDDRSGMMYVSVKFTSPDPQSPALTVGFHGAELISGQSHDGVFAMNGELPAHSITGDWTLSEVYLQDNVFRYSRYTVAPDGAYTLADTVDGWELESGVITLPPMRVGGVTDSTAPDADVSRAAWTTPTDLDSSEDRTVTLSVPVTDDLSGAIRVTATLDGAGLDAPTVTLVDGRLATGTATDGTWEVSGAVPAHLPAGTWRVGVVSLTDRTGRTRTITGDRLAGIAPLTVTGVSDLQRPTADMSWGEYVGATSADNGADRTVRLRIRAGDDVSGIRSIFADFRTEGAQGRLDPIAPAGEDGVWELSGRLPQGTTPGEWRVVGIYITDRVGRERVYWVQADGSYTTRDGLLSGQSNFPRFTLLPVGGGVRSHP
ncbi:calcium-binding protein [Actinoplanes sp. CA-252034]|uniref:calcium-binding protein n=1 Tax=Actinoplanes sp. CA-252034 TaxID=3239906 RepID=UPI003D980EA1